MSQLPDFLLDFTVSFELGKYRMKFDVSKAREDWTVILWSSGV
jgi:hypothetical protein